MIQLYNFFWVYVSKSLHRTAGILAHDCSLLPVSNSEVMEPAGCLWRVDLDNENVVHIYNEILFSKKKN